MDVISGREEGVFRPLPDGGNAGEEEIMDQIGNAGWEQLSAQHADSKIDLLARDVAMLAKLLSGPMEIGDDLLALEIYERWK